MNLASSPGITSPSRAVWDLVMRASKAWSTGGSGNPVRVGGIEVWTLGASGLVANSIGYYDADTYERQLAHGIEK
jgi:hypothetical protein